MIASTLPFYPAGWPLGLGIGAAVLGFATPRAGLALALASAILPLGNISLGLGIAYAIAAAAWLALSWNDARHGLLAALGPLPDPPGFWARRSSRTSQRRASNTRRTSGARAGLTIWDPMR